MKLMQESGEIYWESENALKLVLKTSTVLSAIAPSSISQTSGIFNLTDTVTV